MYLIHNLKKPADLPEVFCKYIGLDACCAYDITFVHVPAVCLSDHCPFRLFCSTVCDCSYYDKWIYLQLKKLFHLSISYFRQKQAQKFAMSYNIIIVTGHLYTV